MAIREHLDRSRLELLDLTTRSRLLHTPRGTRVRTVEVVDELSEQVFRMLVQEGKAMSFLPRPEPEPGTEEEEGEDWLRLLQPEDEGTDGAGVAQRHTDTRLQTKLTSASLQRRLLQMYYDARGFEEEQGVNILYIALGFLKWFEAESSDKPRYAPLILVPVTLTRESARSRFRIAYSGDEISTNLSLQAKLETDFKPLRLPDLPDAEDLSPTAYYDAVESAIAGQPRWEVLRDDIVLGFFSFAKFLMYRDLDPGAWPERHKIEEHPLVAGLLGDGFRSAPLVFPPDASLDAILDPADTVHVVEADSSQALAIEEVRRGRHLVIQGPPGTGKSQTIVNLIAAAVRDGKTVLFVAEKMAALEVVKRRLDEIGLGTMCLELHSHKARKRTVLEDLQRTLSLSRVRGVDATELIERLRKRRDELNEYVSSIHTPLEPSAFTPYRILGHLVRLAARGIRPQDYRFEDCRRWTRQQLREREDRLDQLVEHIREMGTPALHPWRGTGLSVALPQDAMRIQAQAKDIHNQLETWDREVADLARRLGTDAGTLAAARRAANLGSAVAKAPAGIDRGSLAAAIWEERREDVSVLILAGQKYSAAREALADVLVPQAWNEDLGWVRRNLNASGRSLFRMLDADYRRARKAFRGLLVGRAPRDIEAQIKILDTLAEGQGAVRRITELADVGQAAFGTAWKGADSNWDLLAAIDTWESDCRRSDLPDGFRRLVAAIEDVSGLGAQAERVRGLGEAVRQQLAPLFNALQLDLNEAFGQPDLDEIDTVVTRERLAAWAADPSRLQQWIKYRIHASEARSKDLGEIVDRLYDGRIDPGSAVATMRYVYFEELMRVVFEQFPVVAQFNGTAHAKIIDEFRELDAERIRLAREEVAAVHRARIPTGASDIGELGILRRGIQKQRRHLPLRQLLKQAGKAVQAMKPVFMMSPMSVAQYLAPGALEFDLLLIDEASQVQPVDALGAIARCRQLVVVGDDRQLPPTRFFQKVPGEDVQEDEDTFSAADLESILGLCTAQGLPDRMLRWHYRSRHPSLIALSNKEFYRNQLYVVPSPDHPPDIGLHFHRIPGVYDRGGTAKNKVEARAVAKAVIQHARQSPNLSLGVGTFSVSQRDAILDELELLRREYPDVERFFVASGPEPLFVKNLESIQGDERDVIFISVGYGRDNNGYMAMTFGPLSTEGGERRLNVLITRARQRCEVFSSIGAGDIDLDRARSKGVAALKAFLQFAETGQLDVAQPTGMDPESPFEEEVAEALRGLGYEVDHEVGIAGFRIDLAVRDPQRPGRYIIGIECDGARYHSSRSARDRDRLRQKVLEDRGWIIHRIWSTDWYHHPDEQLRKTVEAIERARTAAPRQSDPAPNPDDPAIRSAPTAPTDPKDDHEDDATPESASDPYVEADFVVRLPVEPHLAGAERLVEIVTRIVAIEKVIHREEVGRRLAAVCGKERAGSRIQDAARKALQHAVGRELIARDGDFYSAEPLTELRPRDRSQVRSSKLRDPEMLPPVEIRTGIRMTTAAHVGVTPSEAIVEVVRLFGFQRTGAELKARIEKELRQMMAAGELKLNDGRLYLA